jgi:nucleoside 2-deoxyribosyltransferase
MKVKCFIASAFNYNDVDEIYKKSIVPVLRELNIEPQRVDRINHNKKIDSKIIELIQNCDFGIADLTNARPSVYYEAGFIEGMNKNVIYITRIDHFRPDKNNDVERIHFDLITKNIISWSGPTISFNRKLKSRIKLVLNSIVPQKEINQEEIDSIDRYKFLSLVERVKLGNDHLLQFIEKYKLKPIQDRMNVFGNKNKRVRIWSCSGLTQQDFNYIYRASYTISKDFTINTFFIILMQKGITKARIESMLPSFKQVEDNIYKFKTVKVIFLHSINSEYKIKTLLKDLSLK